MSIATARPIPSYPAPGESSTFEVTYEDYLAMPETNQHVEVVDGVIYVMAGATSDHQEFVLNIATDLRSYVRRTRLGLVLAAPADVLIRKRPKPRVRQPDVFYFSSAKAGFDAGADRARVQRANRDGILVRTW